MQSRPSVRVICASIALLIGLVGCGDGLDLQPVRGKVTYDDGSPLPDGAVVCELVDQMPRRSGNAFIRPDGTFEFGTRKPGDGLVVGKYRALVRPPAFPESETAKKNAFLDQIYTDWDTSGLEFTVERGKNEVEFTVSRPKKKKK
ncbi:hypothetical protein Pla175_36970 [Pirellulimonas nuda]|uniref:Lipoprotein n=1 Tax=Pirellulimonas nuda TaxID=2528009 RepID=A0A518DFQ0_9BACT|nr:carboxypeptidase regulatory-like domain-containing protein [Pirellulimonas nuda]QDU90294.1 hypothetical protein Pla175_36970 [Pirellulimonas nuda]